MPALHIAVLDDEVDITQLLADYLGNQGFRATQVHSGHALMALMAFDPPALVLLDLGLPGEDGFAIARQLREHWRCGLVIVTGRGESVDKVVGLEVGADDYVTKPFALRELMSRIRALLRRSYGDLSNAAGGRVIRHRDLVIDLERRRVQPAHVGELRRDAIRQVAEVDVEVRGERSDHPLERVHHLAVAEHHRAQLVFAADACVERPHQVEVQLLDAVLAHQGRELIDALVVRRDHAHVHGDSLLALAQGDHLSLIHI